MKDQVLIHWLLQLTPCLKSFSMYKLSIEEVFEKETRPGSREALASNSCQQYTILPFVTNLF